MHLQKFLLGPKSLRKSDDLAFELSEVFAKGVGGVKIPEVLVEGDEVAVEGGVLGFGEAEAVGGG